VTITKIQVKKRYRVAFLPNKTVMAEKMHTSRAALNCLLEAEDTNLSLTMLSIAATALGKKFSWN